MHSLIVQPLCRLWKELLACLNEHGVLLNDIYAFYCIVVDKLFGNSSVTSTDNKHLLDMRVHRHRHMHHHLIVNKTILLGKNNTSVKCKKLPELRRSKDIYSLIFALSRIELSLHADIKTHMRRMIFRKPNFHNRYTPDNYY